MGVPCIPLPALHPGTSAPLETHQRGECELPPTAVPRARPLLRAQEPDPWAEPHSVPCLTPLGLPLRAARSPSLQLSRGRVSAQPWRVWRSSHFWVPAFTPLELPTQPWLLVPIPAAWPYPCSAVPACIPHPASGILHPASCNPQRSAGTPALPAEALVALGWPPLNRADLCSMFMAGAGWDRAVTVATRALRRRGMCGCTGQGGGASAAP